MEVQEAKRVADSEGRLPSRGEGSACVESDAEIDAEIRPIGGLVAAVVGCMLAALFVLGVLIWQSVPPALPDVGQGAHLLPVARELPSFELQDGFGQRFDRNSLSQGWSLLFFGYTSCPDVCPTTLQRLAKLEPELAESPAVQVVFVSVDPDRDTEQRVRDYVRFFHESFVGVTGAEPQLNRLTQALGVYYGRGEGAPSDASEGYLVDHSASLFLIDPSGRLHAVLDDPSDAAEFVPLLRRVQGVERGEA